MHAGFIGRQVGNHRELAVVNARSPVDVEVHDSSHARDAGAVEPQPNLRRFGLAIGIEAKRALPSTHVAVGRRRGKMRCDFGKRREIIRTPVEVRLDDGSIEDEQIHVDGAGGQLRAAASAADRKLDVAREAFERGQIELGLEPRRDVEII
ncbi:MAG: hypothetical protein ABSD03_18475, partial [Vulcanimicrobiaceae bacterium]